MLLEISESNVRIGRVGFSQLGLDGEGPLLMIWLDGPSLFLSQPLEWPVVGPRNTLEILDSQNNYQTVWAENRKDGENAGDSGIRFVVRPNETKKNATRESGVNRV